MVRITVEEQPRVTAGQKPGTEEGDCQQNQTEGARDRLKNSGKS